jgi:two-component system NtrC family sensor kinase
MNIEKPEDELKERMKELTCLHIISQVLGQSNGLNENILKEILSSVKKAWQFDQDAIVEIQLSDFTIITSTLPESTVFQISTIYVPEKDNGFIKVHYPAPYTLNNFLEEEQSLLNTVAIEIGNYISKFYILEKKEQLSRTLERIDRLSILGEMTAGIAHEINNPLSNILGYSELIKMTNTDPEIDSDISTIINSVIYTREIVKKMMYFSGKMPHQSKIEKIKPIVTFALSFLKQNFQKKEIKSELHFKNDELTAKIDSVQLTQILFNLLINAIHASPYGSIIKTIIETDNENFFIIIEDQGHGIPDAIKQKVFEPFFTTKDANTGSGLGLSVVHEIVKNNNGDISIKNNIPSGTIFSVRLPRK